MSARSSVYENKLLLVQTLFTKLMDFNLNLKWVRGVFIALFSQKSYFRKYISVHLMVRILWSNQILCAKKKLRKRTQKPANLPYLIEQFVTVEDISYHTYHTDQFDSANLPSLLFTVRNNSEPVPCHWLKISLFEIVLCFIQWPINILLHCILVRGIKHCRTIELNGVKTKRSQTF